MDLVTTMTIDKGQKNELLLVQPVHHPMSVEHQIAILYCGTHGLMRDIPLEKVPEFEKEFLSRLELSHSEVLKHLKEGDINDEISKIIETVAGDVVKAMQV